MELLGVVEDLSEWTRLGRTSWLKCYDVLGYGNADKGKAIMAVVLSKKEALAQAAARDALSRLRNAIQKAEPQRFRFFVPWERWAP